VKRRILEYLAVRKLNPSGQAGSHQRKALTALPQTGRLVETLWRILCALKGNHRRIWRAGNTERL
jgi:hypothetical protein